MATIEWFAYDGAIVDIHSGPPAAERALDSRLTEDDSLDVPAPAEPLIDSPADSDAYGRAALLLVESLIHGLVARSLLSVAEAVSIMEIALDAQIAIADEEVERTPSMHKAATLLSSLVESLRIDLPG